MADLTDSELALLNGRLASKGVSALRPLTGGASSLTYAGCIAGRRIVVKVAPSGVEPIAHRNVLRQSRIIRALERTNVPVPHILFEDAGRPPRVPPLYAMSFLEGTSTEPLFDLHAPHLSDATIAARFRNSARALARLHSLDPTTVDVGDDLVLRPQDEIDRWSRTLQTVDPALVPGWRYVSAALESLLPSPVRPAIVHGDFRLGNLLAVGEEITAVIDWEIWSISDPRVDLGWFLINSDPATYQRTTRYANAAPSTDELIATYCEELGADLPELQWFESLACFKSAATWSLIVKHNRRRPTPDPDLEAMATAPPRLLGRAGELLSSYRGSHHPNTDQP
ncbi:Predicted kinase, aminoglycoside phosphotransferase (APT) family [Mycolicibacterium fluoranthenivorans]|uniref:Predicted kinase, aminoglycoside phosphotransferase (APT) family n=1 Tax=Mycolicibacterium fluoranthenivorans TaxID=258505 RepID=A0A1G4WYP0_9MYCO|nr:Predicted kinase, aminoglycoside phosphotransferase (APT) family [Mycolicibacterium fluoranthenivorans]